MSNKNPTGCSKYHVKSSRTNDGAIMWECRHCNQTIFVTKPPSKSARAHAIDVHILGKDIQQTPEGVNLWGVEDRIKPIRDAVKRGTFPPGFAKSTVGTDTNAKGCAKKNIWMRKTNNGYNVWACRNCFQRILITTPGSKNGKNHAIDVHINGTPVEQTPCDVNIHLNKRDGQIQLSKEPMFHMYADGTKHYG